jgi:hypothetical protein
MHIIAAAYTGAPSASTISLLLSFKGIHAIALADNGSTSTFVDHAFAIKNNLSMIQAPPRQVTVAGGGQLTSTAIANNCTFYIKGHKFTTDFRVLKLQGADVPLGVNWFKNYNPVTFDFIGRSLTFSIEGTPHTFHDHMVPSH